MPAPKPKPRAKRKPVAPVAKVRTPLVTLVIGTSLGRLTIVACLMLILGLVSLKITGAATPSVGSAPPSVASVKTLDVGEYRAEVVFSPAKGTPRTANITLRDRESKIVEGKPVTGILAYLGTQPGHEHNDILISREASPGVYQLSLEEVSSGAWALTIAVGNEARVVYPFVTE